MHVNILRSKNSHRIVTHSICHILKCKSNTEIKGEHFNTCTQANEMKEDDFKTCTQQMSLEKELL